MTSYLPDEKSTDAETSQAVSPDQAEKMAVPAFKFPFAPGNFAPRSQNDQPWHAKGSNPRHEKKIGMAPKGTRRSMGKR